jgi:hypothetical protein
VAVSVCRLISAWIRARSLAAAVTRANHYRQRPVHAVHLAMRRAAVVAGPTGAHTPGSGRPEGDTVGAPRGRRVGDAGVVPHERRGAPARAQHSRHRRRRSTPLRPAKPAAASASAGRFDQEPVQASASTDRSGGRGGGAAARWTAGASGSRRR